jgi:uncharacterized protein with NRDE domain
VSRLEEINAQMRKLQAERSKLEEAERFERNRDLLGKCFRYRNSYGPDSRWWLYAKVVKVTKDGTITTFEFQTDSQGKTDVRPKAIHFRCLLDGYMPISTAEFRKQWRAVQKKIADYKP